MKKFILIILLCMTLAICFVACDTTDNTPDGAQPPEKDTTTNVEALYTVEDISLIEVPPEEKENELIKALINYLKSFFYDPDMPDTSVEIKINQIKARYQPLHVKFDSENYYYMCGYYNATHEYAEYENIELCCVDEYTWVKFENHTDITDVYNDQKFTVAFQINKALFVRNILSDEVSAPDMEHFQIYETKFVDGSNINEPINFDETFIYLNSPDKNIVFYSTSVFNHNWVTLPCIELYGEFYITQVMYTIYPNDVRIDKMLDSEFGEYYDNLMRVMQTEKYNKTNEKEYTYYYGLFRIEDFVKAVFSNLREQNK